MALIMDLAMVLAGVNAVLLGGLTYLYARIYRKSRAMYTMGLMVFAFALFLQNAMTFFAYFTMASLFAEGILPFLLAIAILEFTSVVVVFRVTLI